MSDLKIGQRYKVIASSGLNLRRDPTTSAEILLLMKEGERVTLVAAEVRESDGYHWYNVQYGDEIGWAASEFLKLIPVEAEAPPIGDIRFRFDDPNISYRISTTNFAKYTGTYFFAGPVGQLGKQITYAADGKQITRQSDGSPYWTTQRNIDTMKNQSLLSVIIG